MKEFLDISRNHLQADLLQSEILEEFRAYYLAHVLEQPIFWIPNLEYLQRNFCFDFFNDSENTFWGFFKI